ncbi:hypothetical protein [Kitasatospora camelliae]|uniref:Uncharacterized protein n=1 Tax=Kitasatospora camelliae TaxID=3156397 RepID=A0AAU8JRJ1_9ACTN
MTQDGFAAAERITATLDALSEALVDDRATHYPAAVLGAFRRSGHPSSSALFGLRLSPTGPGLMTIHGLGAVVEASTARQARPAGGPGAVPALLSRYGGGPVRGVTMASDAPSLAAFQLPVTAEPADEKLRPAFAPALAALAAERPTASPEELSTGSGVEVRMVVPPSFFPLILRGGDQALTTHLAEVSEELFAGAGPAARREWAVLSAALADEFAAAGVFYAGVAALRSGVRDSRATLVAAFARRPESVGDLAVALSAERPHAEVWTVLLPAGPAVLLVESRTAPVPAQLTADGQRRWVVSSVMEAFLPLPDGSGVLTVQLSTPHLDDWELYADSFAELLEGVQLGWDGVAAPAPQPAAVPAQQIATPPVSAPPVAPPPVPPAPPAPPVAPPAPPAPPAAEAPKPKGTPVRIPPPDFNPFAPPAPPAAAPAGDGEPAAPGKGTPVRIPPPDFNPFAPPAPTAGGAPAPAAPVQVAAAPAAAPASADPFGTVVSQQAPDPFGTTVTGSTPPPAAPVAAPPVPAQPPTPPGKGTPVRIPPPDFNPFAPPAPPAAAAEDGEEGQAAPSKGTPVRIPPPDFNPFAPPAPSAGGAQAPAAPAAPEPPANNPFG